MKLRFQIKELAYNYVEDNLCDGVLSQDYNNLNIDIHVDGESIATSADLSGGLIFTPTPFNTAANNITIQDIQVESGTHVLIEIGLPETWDKTNVSVVASKSGFNTISKTFTVYGYDLGINSAVPATANNPDVCFILSPTLRGFTFATDTFFLGVGETVTITADNRGTIGNAFTITGDNVKSVAQLVSDWNAANPTNTVTAISPDAGLARVLSNLETLVLTNGTDTTNDDKTYASFHGWRVPFRNDLFLYHNNSAAHDLIEYYNSTSLVSSFIDAILCCEADTQFKQIAYVYDNTSHCPNTVIVDQCETPLQDYPAINHIPLFDFYHNCNSGCCPTNGCIVLGDDNVVKPLADFSVVDLLNVNDIVSLPFSAFDMFVEVYNCEGELVDSDSTTINVALPLPIDLSAVEIPITIPERGDYVIQVIYKLDGVFECKYSKKFEACDQYTITKKDCGKYEACIYKIGGAGSEVLKVGKLDENKVFQPYVDFNIPYCTCIDIDLLEDGVYNFEFQGTTTSNLIVVVDCKWKECALGKIKQLACTKKADCACGGNCNGDCTSVPQDLYDLNAFAALSYGYFSLINNEYLNNYIYSTLDPNKLDELHTINQFLTRALEYCEECKFVVTKNNDCGCK